MLRDMKTHMRAKLENRYSEDDQIFLKTYSFLDPRQKNDVQAGVCQGNLRKHIEKFVKANDEDIIPGTQGQELENVSNYIFQTPRTSSPGQNSDMSILE